MQETIQIFVGNNSLDLVDFYPDDLPKEWRFDYYSAQHNAMMIACDSGEDLIEICEDLSDDFKLVIDISTSQNIEKLLQDIAEYKDNFILYSNKSEHHKHIKNYNFCIQSDNNIKHCKTINGHCFNNYQVLFFDAPKSDIESKKIIQEVADFQENSVIIFKKIDAETLSNVKIITELLEFY